MALEILVYDLEDGANLRVREGKPVTDEFGLEILENAELSSSNLESARRLLKGETDKPQVSKSSRSEQYIYSVNRIDNERLNLVHSFCYGPELFVDSLDYPETVGEEALNEVESLLSDHIGNAAEKRRNEAEAVITEIEGLQEEYTHPALLRMMENHRSEFERWRDGFEQPSLTEKGVQFLMAVPVEGFTDQYQIPVNWHKMSPVEDLGLVERRELQYQPDNRVTLYSSGLDSETREQAMSIIRDEEA